MRKFLFVFFVFATSSPTFAGGLQCQINGTCECQRDGTCDKDGNPIQPRPFVSATQAAPFSSLTCDTDRGEIKLDLRNQTARINVYCHELGCTGTGVIRNYSSDLFNDTFLLEMKMDGISGLAYMMVKVKPEGAGEIFNHPKISMLFSCLRH